MRRFWCVWALFVASAVATNNTTPENQGPVFTATHHMDTLANHAFGPPEHSHPAAGHHHDERQPSYRAASPTFQLGAGQASSRPADLQASESADYPYAFQGHPAASDGHAVGYVSHGDHFGAGPHGDHFGAVPHGDHFGPGPHGDHFSPFHHGADHHGGRDNLEGHAGHGGYRYQTDIAMGLIGFLIVLSTLQNGLITLTRQGSLLEALHGRKRRDTYPHLLHSAKEGDGSWILHQDNVLRCAQRRACEANRLLVTRYGLAGRRQDTLPNHVNGEGVQSSDWLRLVHDAEMAGLKGEDCAVLYRGCKDSRYLRGI